MNSNSFNSTDTVYIIKIPISYNYNDKYLKEISEYFSLLEFQYADFKVDKVIVIDQVVIIYIIKSSLVVSNNEILARILHHLKYYKLKELDILFSEDIKIDRIPFSWYNDIKSLNQSQIDDIKNYLGNGPLKLSNARNIDTYDLFFEYCNILKSKMLKGEVKEFNEAREKVKIKPKFSKGISLGNINLEGINLSDSELEEINMRGTNLRKGILKRIIIQNSNLANVILEDAEMQNANLKNVNMKSTNLKKAILQDANLTGINCRFCDLTNANLTNSNLSAANIANCNLTNANLTNSNIYKTNIVQSLLDDVTINKTNLSDIKLESNTQQPLWELIHAGIQNSHRITSSNKQTPVPDSQETKGTTSDISNTSNTSVSIADELRKLTILKEEGILTEQEFNQIKQKLIK